jgi:hypothetical protein
MTTSHTPADAAAAVLHNPALPPGDDERFAGFGVLGLPFASGHYLAPASASSAKILFAGALMTRSTLTVSESIRQP